VYPILPAMAFIGMARPKQLQTPEHKHDAAQHGIQQGKHIL